jgi:hypothetical protein
VFGAGESMRRNPHYVLEMFSKLKEWTEDDKSSNKNEKSMAEILRPKIQVYNGHNIDQIKEAFASLAERKVVGKAIISFQNNNQQLMKAKL